MKSLVNTLWTLTNDKNVYRNFPKYLDTQTICCNRSKIWTMWLYHRVMSPNDANGKANSVDPDQNESKRCKRKGKQCRPWADCSLIWVCTVCPGISVRKQRIIRVVMKMKQNFLKHMLVSTINKQLQFQNDSPIQNCLHCTRYPLSTYTIDIQPTELTGTIIIYL